jgi:hypothetical protein
MAHSQQPKGRCGFCGRELTRSGLTKHLRSCSQRAEAIAASNQSPRREQVIYHLHVQDAWQGYYWLHLEMNGSATLEDLDHYLRMIWLECCGHLSRFSQGGWRGEEISKNRRADKTFKLGVELTHIYDFGTSSETLIKVIDTRTGKPLTDHPLYLMARNNLPRVSCTECDEPTSWLCLECIYELEQPGTLCDQHAKAHPHENYGEPIPFVNSPRVGMCGYTGPADPPY